MKDQKLFVDPLSNAPLVTCEEGLVDPLTGNIYPCINGVIVFTGSSSYASSFGYQWGKFSRTQLDTYSGSDLSRERLSAETGWNISGLSGECVLEVGSGPGRFTEVLASSCTADLYSVDISSAIFLNAENNSSYSASLSFAQASIYELPFRDNTFDKVFCLGVLQHTPCVYDSIAALVSKTRPGGQIVVDFYPYRGWFTLVHAKYILRPITRLLPKTLLLAVIRMTVPVSIRIFDLLCRMKLSILTRFLPIADIRLFPSRLSKEEREEWAIMDTLDAYSPAYDQPQRLESVVGIFKSLGCDIEFAGTVEFTGGSATVVRARKG